MVLIYPSPGSLLVTDPHLRGSDGSIFLSDGAGFDYGLGCGCHYNTQSFLLLMFTIVMLKNITAIRMRLDCFLYQVDVLVKRLLKTEQYLNHDHING